MDQYQKQYFLPEHFTLQIKNLPKDKAESEVVADLKSLIDKINYKLTKQSNTPIIDINVAQPSPVFIVSSILDKLLKQR